MKEWPSLFAHCTLPWRAHEQLYSLETGSDSVDSLVKGSDLLKLVALLSKHDFKLYGSVSKAQIYLT